MASIRMRPGSSGMPSFAVLFSAYGKQTSETFRGPGAEKAAVTFKQLVERVGGETAKEHRAAMNEESAEKPTVTEMVEQHIAALSGVERGTRDDYLSYVRLSLRGTRLGGLPLDIVRREDVSAWINELEAKGYAAKSIRNRQSLVSAAFTRAVRSRLRPDNPAEGHRLPTSKREERVFLTHDEFALLLSHFDPFWQPFIITLAGTGMRFSEATALQVRDVHLDDTPPTLTVNRSWKHTAGKGRLLGPPKTKRGRRTIGLNASMVRTLRPLVEGKAAEDYVLTNRQGRPILHTSWYKRHWIPAVAAAMATEDQQGRPIPAAERLTKRPRVHDLRHSHASWLIAGGRPLTEIQYRLGHESIQTTSDTYGHLMPGHLSGSADVIEIALSQALPELEELDH